MTERYAVAYLRRSTADDKNPGNVSREAQDAAIRDLAQRDGYSGELHTFEDWNRSADEAKESKRAAFLGMLAAIERGEVSTVYAYALDRLYRSMHTFVRLTDAAKARDTRIVTAREGVLGGDGSPMARAFSEITAVFSSLELNTIKARNRGAAKARKDRGDRMGQPPYGLRVVRDATGAAVKPITWEDDPERPLAPVLEAYARAHSVLGACKRLREVGVPNARGGDLWQPTSLSLILDRAGVLPPHGKRRHYAKGAYLAGLLRCGSPGCGRILTPDHAHLRTGTAYYCARAKWIGTPAHGPGWVRESVILPIVRAEAERLRLPNPDVAMGQDDPGAKRDSLTERKRRLGMAFVDKLLEEDDYRAELDAIGREVEHLDAAVEIIEGVHLNWSAPVADVNAALRALFEYVRLGPDMSIAKIEWRVPEWRS